MDTSQSVPLTLLCTGPHSISCLSLASGQKKRPGEVVLVGKWRLAIDVRNFSVEDVGQLLLGVCFSPAALGSTEEEVIGLNHNLQLAALGLNLTALPPLPPTCFLFAYFGGESSLDYSSTLKNWEASRENLASLERLEGIAVTLPI